MLALGFLDIFALFVLHIFELVCFDIFEQTLCVFVDLVGVSFPKCTSLKPIVNLFGCLLYCLVHILTLEVVGAKLIRHCL